MCQNDPINAPNTQNSVSCNATAHKSKDQLPISTTPIKRIPNMVERLILTPKHHHNPKPSQLNRLTQAFRIAYLQRLLVSSVIGVSMLGVTSHVAHAASTTDINALVSEAVSTHPLVRAAQAERLASAEYVNAAKLNMFPLPIIGTTYDKDDGFVTRAGLRQSVWSGGKLTANVNQAIYDDKAAMANILEQQNTVAKNTIDVWQSYLYSMALQGLYVNNIKSLYGFESMMKRRVEQGVSARIDLDLVTNRILQDQNAYQGAVQQQRIAVARLSQMIGRPISDVGLQYIPLDLMAKYVKSQSKDFERMAFSEASINNPSVIKQQFETESAKQKVKADKAALYPAVYAQFEELYYHKDNEADSQFSFGVSYDPGAGFSNLATARASEARVQSFVENQEASRRTVMENIQTQYQQFVSAKDQETSLIAAVAGAQIVVDSYRRQFIAGRKTWLEVLNAVREKSGYQQQLLQVQSQMLAAFYKLQVDFGRMPWQQNTLNFGPTREFHPYLELEEWVKQQADKHELPLYFLNDESAAHEIADETASETGQNGTTESVNMVQTDSTGINTNQAMLTQDMTLEPATMSSVVIKTPAPVPVLSVTESTAKNPAVNATLPPDEPTQVIPLTSNAVTTTQTVVMTETKPTVIAKPVTEPTSEPKPQIIQPTSQPTVIVQPYPAINTTPVQSVNLTVTPINNSAATNQMTPQVISKITSQATAQQPLEPLLEPRQSELSPIKPGQILQPTNISSTTNTYQTKGKTKKSAKKYRPANQPMIVDNEMTLSPTTRTTTNNTVVPVSAQ